MNHYILELRTVNPIILEGRELSIAKNGDHYCGTVTVNAESRSDAVRKSLLMFWDIYKGKLGQAKGILTVSDPLKEVRYSNTFNCNDKGNRYLDEDTLQRVLTEARGELIRDDRVGEKYHAHGSVRRVKRRRKFWQRIAPTIYRSESGVLYYRVVSQGQVSKKRELLTKRKYRVFRLWSKTVAKAIDEIKERKLRSEHHTRRWVKARSLKWVAFVAGIAPLNEDDRGYFANILHGTQKALC